MLKAGPEWGLPSSISWFLIVYGHLKQLILLLKQNYRNQLLQAFVDQVGSRNGLGDFPEMP